MPSDAEHPASAIDLDNTNPGETVRNLDTVAWSVEGSPNLFGVHSHVTSRMISGRDQYHAVAAPGADPEATGGALW